MLREVKPLVKALDAGYAHRPDEMLRYFVSEVMNVWGLEPWERAPASVRKQIWDAIGVYSDLVSKLEPFEDILGPVYMELASHGAKKHLAQYFTPWGLAQMMARINIGPLPDGCDLIRTVDPACGSGAMLLAFANTALKDWKADGLRRLSMTGVDLDPYCARMCAVQLVANCNIHKLRLGEILVLQGNSLLDWSALTTVLHAVNPATAPAPRPLTDPRAGQPTLLQPAA